MSHQCPHCEAWYAVEADLAAHLELVHRCPKCGLLLTDENAVEAHLAEVHGMGQFMDAIEPELAMLEEIPGWKPREIPVPTDQEELHKWLLPICELIAQANKPEHALDKAPPELTDRVDYVRQHFDRVAGTLKLVRYKRLKDPARKAEYLVIALAHLGLSPSYALQRFSAERPTEG
jgi:predicted Zn finger-like uncharacterized protein